VPTITIRRQSVQTQLNANGSIQRLIRVDFMVGDDGPFDLSFDAEAFNAETANQKIQEFANQIAALRTKVKPS